MPPFHVKIEFLRQLLKIYFNETFILMFHLISLAASALSFSSLLWLSHPRAKLADK